MLSKRFSTLYPHLTTKFELHGIRERITLDMRERKDGLEHGFAGKGLKHSANILPKGTH